MTSNYAFGFDNVSLDGVWALVKPIGNISVGKVYVNRDGYLVEVFCTNATLVEGHNMGVIGRELSPNKVDIPWSWSRCEVNGDQELVGEFDSFYRGTPLKPGAYWTKRIGGNSANAGYCYWNGDIWSANYGNNYRGCARHAILPSIPKKASRKLEIVWRPLQDPISALRMELLELVYGTI